MGRVSHEESPDWSNARIAAWDGQGGICVAWRNRVGEDFATSASSSLVSEDLIAQRSGARVLEEFPMVDVTSVLDGVTVFQALGNGERGIERGQRVTVVKDDGGWFLAGSAFKVGEVTLSWLESSLDWGTLEVLAREEE